MSSNAIMSKKRKVSSSAGTSAMPYSTSDGVAGTGPDHPSLPDHQLGPEMGTFLLIVGLIGLTSWMQTARIVRGDVLALKEREFILAARSIGTTPRNLILNHILPNVMSPILVSATLGIATAIITESALSFLGFGFPPDFPTWGKLLNDAVDRMTLYPERVIWPGTLISLTVLSVNYLGDGLRDALDPRSRSR